METSQQELFREVQKELGFSSTPPRGAKGYVAAYLAKPWVADLLTRHPRLTHGRGAETIDPFWLPVNVTSGAKPQFLVAVQQVCNMTAPLRPPEAHPGLLEPTIALPIQLRSSGGRVFRRPLEVSP